MAKKEIVILALTAALLMTTHAVPASAAENTPDGVPQTTSTRVITPRWESTNTVVPLISISGKKISVSVVIEPQKIDDLICGHALFGKESRKQLVASYFLAD